MTRVLNNSLLVLCLLLCCSLHAQFKNTASLAPVPKAGFYAIAVTPELSSYIKTDFSDLRIKDDKGLPAPYIISRSAIKVYDTTYTQLKITQSRLDDSGRTIITIENVAKASLNSLALLIRNNAVSRHLSVTGSDDNQHWFSISENGLLEGNVTGDKDRYMQAVDIPTSSYHYFRLLINNGQNTPLNIISAGVYKLTGPGNKLNLVYNPASTFTQVDSSDGYSYIYVSDEYAFHKMRVNVESGGQKFYLQSANVIDDNKIIAGFPLVAGLSVTTVSPSFKSKNWTIKISNFDNPPTKVTSIKTAQEEIKIVAWFEAGKAYHLEMNDSFAVAPVYSLQNFKDSIPASVDEIKVGEILPVTIKAAVTSKSFFTKAWLWPVMIAVLLVLVVFTLRLTKEMGKRGE